MSKADVTKKYEDLALRWLNFLKFRLAQDGATFRDQIVELFGKWLIAKPSRITRYEDADFKMLDEFLDLAWPAIMDPKVPMPPEPAVPKKAAGPARQAPNWWAGNDDPGRVVFQGARVAQAGVDWAAINRQLHEQQAQMDMEFVRNNAAGQQWIVFDQNGNPVNR